MVRHLFGRAKLARALLLVLATAYGVVSAGGQSAAVVATSVPLLLPTGVAYDGAGNLYIAEAGAHRVRKVDTQGMMTTVAGDGSQGYGGDGGAATAAQMDTPMGVAVDGGGNVYVCDSHNHRLRRVDAVSGLMTTVAGTGVAGFAGDGGAATAAMLDLPVAVAVDGAGDVWVADAREHRVRRVDARTGVIGTVAGTGVEGFSGDGGLAVGAMLDAPSSLAVDAGGNVYVADAHNGRVRRVDARTGVISTVVGRSGQLRLPRGVALDAGGALYVSDASDFRVRQVDAGGGTAVAGAIAGAVAGSGVEGFTGDMGSPTAATMGRPAGMAMSPAGLLTLAEAGDGRVREVTAAPVIETIAGLGSGAADRTLNGVTVELSGAGTTVYGAGSVAVQVVTNGAATGTLTLLDGGVVVGTAAAVSGAAVFPVGSLGVGVHALSARYSGDGGHAAGVSAGMGLAVTPAAVQVVVSGAAMPYGAAIPTMSGGVSGVLAQDAGRVLVVYGTAAASGSAVGTYPITAALSGAGAGNYVLSVVPGVLTVVQAGTATVIGSAVVQSGDQSVLATVTVRSATTGVPTGVLTLLDGGTPVAAGAVSGAGSVTLASGSLASGAHSFTAFYAGDGNFVASTSAGFPVTVGAGSPAGPSADFALSTTGATTQVVSGGSSVNFGLWAKWTAATMSSPVTLAVSGLPAFATAAFNPPYLPPGGAVSGFTMTVAMPVTVAAGVGGAGRWMAAMCLGLPVLLVGRRRGLGRGIWVVLLAAGLMSATGCGDRVTATTDGAGVTKRTYPLTVTGTGTDGNGVTLQRTVQVVLVVESGG